MYQRNRIVMGATVVLMLVAMGRTEEKLSEEDMAIISSLDRIMPPEMLSPGADFQEPPKHLIFNFRKNDLADVIDFMRDDTGANFFVNWKALEAIGIQKNTPVTVKLYDPTLKEALSKTLELVSTPKGKARYVVEDGVIKISVAVNPKSATGAVVAPAIPEKLDRVLPEVNFADSKIGDVIDFLRDVGGVKINVDWDALKAAGIERNMTVGLRAHRIRLSSVLKLVMESVSDGATPVVCKYQERLITVSAGVKRNENLKPNDAR